MARGIEIPITPRAFVKGAGSGSLVRRGSTAAFLVALILGLDALRRGGGATRGQAFRWPTRTEFAGYVGAGLIFLLAASVAPDLVTMLLTGILVIQLLRAAPVITGWARRVAADLQQPPGKVGGFQPTQI